MEKNKFIHKKSLGQHFIKDSNLHRKIASKAGNIENYNIVEIGPGDGGLSKAILEKKPKKLFLIEKDNDLMSHLQSIFKECNVEIINGDGTLIDIRKITEQPVKIIANLPYNVATNMILNWLEYGNFFESMTVLIQKEVADRFLANVGDGSYGRTAILTKLVTDVRKEFDVPPGAFNPPPKVNSTLITFVPLKENRFNIAWKDISNLTKVAFTQPRKTIMNNLKGQYQNILEVLNELRIDPKKRPENLSLEDFHKIFVGLKG